MNFGDILQKQWEKTTAFAVTSHRIWEAHGFTHGPPLHCGTDVSRFKFKSSAVLISDESPAFCWRNTVPLRDKFLVLTIASSQEDFTTYTLLGWNLTHKVAPKRKPLTCFPQPMWPVSTWGWPCGRHCHCWLDCRNLTADLTVSYLWDQYVSSILRCTFPHPWNRMCLIINYVSWFHCKQFFLLRDT